MAALETGQDYATEARRLLQDRVVPYRYPDDHFLSALNIGLLEARRMRPDLFIGRAQNVPDYTALAQIVDFSPQYRSALAYYIAGRVLLADTEATDEARASAFLQKFIATLGTGV
jgi:hypothetical protein